MNRRGFVHLLSAGLVATTLPELEPWKRRFFPGYGGGLPTLYGDGVHDDLAALDALFAGGRVHSKVDGRTIDLDAIGRVVHGRRFALSDQLVIRDRR